MADQHIAPGFLTPSAAKAMMDVAGRTEKTRQDLQSRVPMSGQRLPVKLTSSSGVYHAWVEQAFDATGERYDKPGGYSGTATTNPVVTPNRTTLTTPTHAWIERTIWNATYGVIFETLDSGTGSASGDCADGCGWVAGLTPSDCLSGSVLSAVGRCEDNTDAAWSSTFVYDDGEVEWLAEDVLEISNVDYTVAFLRDHDPVGGDPQLILTSVPGSGEGTIYWATLDCCGDGYAVFAVGVVCTGATLCPPNEPGVNVVRIRVEYAACPNPDYHGPGWYCVSDDDCSTTNAVYLGADPGVCIESDTGYFRICSGPYASEEAATDACAFEGSGEPGTLDPVDPPPCDGKVLPAILSLSVSNEAGACAGRGYAITRVNDTLFTITGSGGRCDGGYVTCAAGVEYQFLISAGSGCFCPGAEYYEMVYYSEDPFIMILDAVRTTTMPTDRCFCDGNIGAIRFTVTGS